MRPEEVPVQFGRETITHAVTAWTMGTTLFSEGENDQALGQLFAILVGDRIRIEADGHSPDPGDLLASFVEHLRGQIPEDLRSQFAGLDPANFDSTYQAVVGQAREAGVDMQELSVALREIAAVTRHFADRVRDSEA